MHNSELTDIIEILQYSPREPGQINPDLLGWQTPAGIAVFVLVRGRATGHGYYRVEVQP